MPGPFRDDLEAARSRVDALREQNEDLRAELSRLRRQPLPPKPAVPAPAAAPSVDPELARLTEHTLEELDRLNGEIDEPPLGAAPFQVPAPLARAVPHAPPPAREARAELGPPVVRPDGRAELTAGERRELEALRKKRARAPAMMGATLVVGVLLGVALALVLR